MKQRIMICALAAAMSVVACKKEEPAQGVVSLEASVPSETKVTVSGQTQSSTSLSWEASDKLWVRSSRQPSWERGECFLTSASGISSDGKKAVFNGTVRTDGLLAAVYPYQMVSEGSDNDKVVLNLEQSYPLRLGSCPENTIAAAAFWTDGAKSMNMEYIFGAVQFSVKGNGQKLTKVTLLEKDANTCLWGKCTVVPNYSKGKIKSVAMSNDSDTRNQVTLTLDTPVTLSAQETSFFFTLPENTLRYQVVLTLYFEGGASREFKAGPFNNINRGKVTRMPTVDCSN